DVNFFVGHLQEKQRGGKNGRRQNVAVGFVNRVQNQPVAHQAAIHENIDAVAIHPLDVRPRGKSADGQRSFFFSRLELGLGDGGAEGRGGRGDFHQLFQCLTSEKLIHAVGQLFRGRAIDDFLCRGAQNELLRWIRQGVVRDQRSDVAQLRCIGLEKFSARWNAIKNVGDADRRSLRQS